MPRITYDSTKIGGDMVAQAMDHFRKGRDLISRAKSLADSVAAGGATPALLEASPEFGVAAGKGADFYSAVANAKTNAATITDAAIADLDQG